MIHLSQTFCNQHKTPRTPFSHASAPSPPSLPFGIPQPTKRANPRATIEKCNALYEEDSVQAAVVLEDTVSKLG